MIKLNQLSYITYLGLFFGIIGTTLGGIFGASLKIKSNKLLSFILELSAGLMTSIICFDLIPESLKFTSIFRFASWSSNRNNSYDFLSKNS